MLAENPVGETSAEASGSATGARCDWAILFVHGIGQPAAGATIERFGQPFAEFAMAQAPGPATKLVRNGDSWRLTLDHAGTITRWLLVEVRWADLVAASPYRVLLRWLVLVAPWIFHSDALSWRYRRARQQQGRSMRRLGTALRWSSGQPSMFWAVTRSSLLLLAGIAVQLVVLVVGLAGLVPVLRRPARLIQRLLVRSVGDSFGYLYDEQTWARIQQRLVDSVVDAGQRAERVAVVTHSQATAVMHRALWSRTMPDLVTTWLSLGSGLQKLLELRLLSTRALTAWAVLRVLALVMILGTVPDWIWTTDPVTGAGEASPAIAGAVLVVLALLLAPYLQVRMIRDRLGPITAQPVRPYSLRWLDLHTFHDPVPAGPLPGVDLLPGRIDSVEVHNLGSFLRDHSAYQHNDEQVLATLYRLVSPPVAGHRSTLPAHRRRRRVQWRRPLWLLIIGTGFGVVAPLLRLVSWPPAQAVILIVGVAGSHLVLESAWRGWNARATALARRDPARTAGTGRIAVVVAGWSLLCWACALFGPPVDSPGYLAAAVGVVTPVLVTPVLLALLWTLEPRARRAADRSAPPPWS